jgi:hypothetical protein
MALLAGLRDGSLDAGDVGDPTLLQQRFERESDRYIASTLGRGFVQRLAGLPARGWQGPVESVYGLHLVYVEQRVAGELPALEEVRDAVLRDWSAEQRRQLNEEVYQELRQRYEVVIEPEPGEQEAGAGALRIGS